MYKKCLSNRQITYARIWLEKCTRPSFDLSADEVEDAIDKHYFGGLRAFYRESSRL